MANIQKIQNRFQKLIDSAEMLDYEIAKELKNAKEKYQQFQQKLVNDEEIALALRNPIEHLKGRFWERTKKIYKEENGDTLLGKFKWFTMAAYIAKNGKASDEYN